MQYAFRCILFIFSTILLFTGCTNEHLPKPKGMLRLNYPTPNYKNKKTLCGFTFDQNKESSFKSIYKRGGCACEIKYPKLNATIFLTHRKINKDLKKLLTDAQNLTQEHVVKADDIKPREYINNSKQVYGMSYEVIGDAASPAQFYVTDSISNFLLGSVYFKAKPNYDSILPAATYLRNDIRILMESLKW